MQRLVKQYKTNLAIREKALSLVRKVPDKDFAAQARVIFAWVRDHIRYVGDVNGVETIQTPDQTLRLGQGDCDDKALLLCALLESIGHKTRFLAIGRLPGHYEHVLAETRIGKAWFAMETTEPYSFGQPPRGRWAQIRVHN